MSKTYIVSRNGGTVTKAPINDNKIPIYDSQQDAESDLVNLEEGQIVGTKEDKFNIDDMKQYIRNQNVLSDWENITISTDSNNPTVFDKDGFLLIHDIKTNKVHINNEFAVWLGRTQPLGAYSCPSGTTIPVKIGNQVYINTAVDSKEGVSKIAYYKLRDYSDR